MTGGQHDQDRGIVSPGRDQHGPRLGDLHGNEMLVARGIGLVGHTGLAKGSELHFEIRRNNRPVDPVEELPEAK
jgi:hypothetical protein